jgi:Flp pilus assembly protein TadG
MNLPTGRRLREESGQAFVLVAVMALVMLALVGIVLDVGHAFHAKRELQASVDAAALAAAQDLPDVPTASSTARQYSSSPGQKNVHPDLPNVTTAVTPKCFTSLTLPCNPVNGIVVKETASVPTTFLGVLGIRSFTVSATGSASMRGGAALPLDIMVVVDRTGSMCTPCSKIQEAKAGVLEFLQAMRPSVDMIGLELLPPATSVASRCNTASNSNYDTASNPYVVVPLSNNFKTTDTSPLNQSSALVQTVNCISTGGITSYATAIDSAQTALNAQGRPNAQDVIIFFTDGEANYGPFYYGNSSAYRKQPCGQGITSAANAKAHGTWVYTIGYDTASNVKCAGYKNTSGCNQGAATQFACDEVPARTAVPTLQSMASTIDSDLKFYNQPQPGDLTSIFKSVAEDLTMVRLISDDTP